MTVAVLGGVRTPGEGDTETVTARPQEELDRQALVQGRLGSMWTALMK